MGIPSNTSPKSVKPEISNLVHSLIWAIPTKSANNFPEKWRGLGHVTIGGRNPSNDVCRQITLAFLIVQRTADGRLDVNVALNRPSYSSSTWFDGFGTYPPSHGNDGDKSNCHAFLAGQSVAASAADLNPWYAIDLGVELEIAGVKLTHRSDYWGK